MNGGQYGQAGRARHSLLYSFAERYTVLLLGIGATMVLARLLTPAEIGIYSVGAVLVGLAQVVRDFGVGQYLIQERELDTAQLRAALCVSFAVAWLLALLVFLAGGPVAQFYHEPRLQTVVRLLALNFVLIPFSSVTMPLLRRALRFNAVYLINAANGLASALVAIGLALAGFGYLSLVWAALAGSLATLLVSLCFRPPALPWLPGLTGVPRVLRFGLLSTGGGMIDEAGVAAPDLIIGKLIDLASVGLFSKALGLVGVFNQAITSAISPVIYPLFSQQVREGHDLRRAYLSTASYISALAWPFFAFLALLALPLVNLLYGNQWHGVVPLIRIMCFSSALYSMFSMARYLFLAMGQVEAQARLDATAVPFRIGALLLAAPFGLVWVAWAVLAGAVFRSWLSYRCLKRLAGVGAVALLSAVRKSLGLTAFSTLIPALLVWGDWRGGSLWWWPLLPAAAGALLGWIAGIMLLKHEFAAELVAWRRKLSTPAGAETIP